jgi:phospholipase/carboxylesterase
MTLQTLRRSPASGGTPKQLVVFVHGYGANGADLMGMADMLGHALPEAEFVAPDAPDRVPGAPMGFQWFPISALDIQEMTRGARIAAPVLNAFLDAELARLGLEDSDLALVGFSQGTMLSLQAGLRRKVAPAIIVGFSGALPDVAALPDELACKPPVFLAHGEADTVVPWQATEIAAQTLAKLGLGVAVHMTPGLAHGIAPEALQIAGLLMRDAYAGALNLPAGMHTVSAAASGSA